MDAPQESGVEPDEIRLVSGQTLRQLRESTDLSQGEVARRMGKKEGKQLSEWETGKVVPGPRNLALLLGVLGKTLEDYGQTYLRVARVVLEARESVPSSVSEGGDPSSSYTTDPRDRYEADFIQIQIRDVEVRIPLDRVTLLGSAPGTSELPARTRKG